jgi:hypothetical protein
MAPRCPERTARAVGNLEGGLAFPSPGLHGIELCSKISHSVHENGHLAIQVAREQQQGSAGTDADRCDSGSHRLDGEDYLPTEDIDDIRHVIGHIPARHVQEVELFEAWR